MNDAAELASQLAVRGSALMAQRKLEEAAASFREAIRLHPEYAGAHNDLGNALRLQGDLGGAIASYREALRQRPDIAQIHQNLGTALAEQGALADAEASLCEAVRLQPQVAGAHHDLGILLQKSGRPHDAIACFVAALQLNPGHGQRLSYLNALIQAGQTDEALQVLQQWRLRGLQGEAGGVLAGVAAAYSNLGNALRDQGRALDAEASCRDALVLKPDFAEAHNNLGNALNDQDRLDQAQASYRRALELKPDYAEAHYNLGNSLLARSRLIEAESSYRRALEFKPAYADAHNNLGAALQMQGRLDEAEASIRRALQIKPDDIKAYGNLLFTLNYDPDKSGEEIFASYREYNHRFGIIGRAQWRTHSNSRNTERRLRVGYLSPDFCKHPVRHFLEPVLANHDKGLVEVYAYAEYAREDEATGRYKRYVDHWVPTRGLTDDALAQRIRADGIDILVELAGHTAGTRLPVLARKPAPVSVTWLGYGYSTGLSAIDYFLTDDTVAPRGSEALFSERVWRLATPGFVYRPAQGMGEVNSLPALATGRITFGTLTRAVRINHRTVQVWSKVMQRVANSRLVIDSSSFRDAAMQDALAMKFTAHGIDRERVQIGYRSPPWDLLRTIDLGLDCFPHNSGTTLFEMLYMGVPFVTLAGRPSVGRLGASLLVGIGHPEWIARTEDEYVDIVLAIAADLPKLAVTRSRLRDEMRQSALMDEYSFARKLEVAYREMWKGWCLATGSETI